MFGQKSRSSPFCAASSCYSPRSYASLVFVVVDVNRYTVTARLMSFYPSDGWFCRREKETHDPPFWFGTTPLMDYSPIGSTIKEKNPIFFPHLCGNSRTSNISKQTLLAREERRGLNPTRNRLVLVCRSRWDELTGFFERETMMNVSAAVPRWTAEFSNWLAMPLGTTRRLGLFRGLCSWLFGPVRSCCPETIAQGGVLPSIQAVLLSRRRREGSRI